MDRFADTQIDEDTQPPPPAEVVDESPPKDPLEKLVTDELDNKENVGNDTPRTGVNVGNGTPPTGAKAEVPNGRIPRPKPKGAPKSRRMVIDALTQESGETQPPEESPAPETQPPNAGE